MKVSVWDTYVQRKDGQMMHFDILVPSDMKDNETIVGFGRHYLESKPFAIHQLTTKECRFCHIEHATEEVLASITKMGYGIIEMENCH